jgi:hypothetical protein
MDDIEWLAKEMTRKHCKNYLLSPNVQVPFKGVRVPADAAETLSRHLKKNDFT